MTRPPVERIAVVIPARDSERTLAACVASVLAGTRAPDRLIVVDDGSRDRTAEIAAELARAHAPRVSVVSHASSRGPAAARNAGARAAGADAYFFLDSDTELAPDALDRFAARLAEADAVCGVYAPEPLGQGAAARYKAWLDHFHFSRRGVVEYDGFSGYCGGVRKAAFDAIRGFDERLRAGDDYENEDFGYRLSASHRTLLDPAIRARHHFPDLPVLSRTYFRRVRQWARLFCERGRFESAGDATAGTGAATLALPAAILLVPSALVSPLAWAPLAGCVAVWLVGYGPFFAWAIRRDASAVPSMLAIHAWCSTVISAGAIAGVLDHARGTLAREPRHA